MVCIALYKITLPDDNQQRYFKLTSVTFNTSSAHVTSLTENRPPVFLYVPFCFPDASGGVAGDEVKESRGNKDAG